jgi:hypothetical protein
MQNTPVKAPIISITHANFWYSNSTTNPVVVIAVALRHGYSVFG